MPAILLMAPPPIFLDDGASLYAVLHMFMKVFFGAWNGGNHQNFDKSLLPKNLWLIFMGKMCFFFQNGRLEKTEMGQIFDDYPGFQTKTTPA